MSFNVGNKSESKFKRWIGVASTKIITFNPDKEELTKLFNSDNVRDPIYIEERDGIERVRLTFFLQPHQIMHKEAADLILPLTFTIQKQQVKGANSGKYQVIDSYGRTGWVTEEELKKQEVPAPYLKYNLLSNDYRPAYIGEESVTNFIKAYANIPNYSWTDFNTREIKTISNPNEAKARFDNIDKLFIGDYSDIMKLLAATKGYLVKVAIGVRTTEDNRLYQDVFARAFVKNASSNYNILAKEIKSSQENGAYPSTEFFIGNLKEYVLEYTDKENLPKPEDIFEAPATKPVNKEVNDLPDFFTTSGIDDLDAIFKS